MSRIFLTIAVFAAAFTASADVCELYWKNAEADGLFSDESMWYDKGSAVSSTTEHFDDGADRYLRIKAASGVGVTNNVRLASYNMLGALSLFLQNESAVTLDGEDVVFKQHSPGEGIPVNNTSYDPFNILDKTEGDLALKFTPATLANDSTFLFSNSLQTISRSNSGSYFFTRLQL